MLVKWTKSIEGGEKRGYVEGREFDWPMILISKMRRDYGQDCLVMVGTLADRNARSKASTERRHGEKPSRQERLGVAVFERPTTTENQVTTERDIETRPRRRGRPRKIRVESDAEIIEAMQDESVAVDELMATA